MGDEAELSIKPGGRGVVGSRFNVNGGSTETVARVEKRRKERRAHAASPRTGSDEEVVDDAREPAELHAMSERQHHVADRFRLPAGDPGTAAILAREKFTKAPLCPGAIEPVIRLGVELVHELDKARNVAVSGCFHGRSHRV